MFDTPVATPAHPTIMTTTTAIVATALLLGCAAPTPAPRSYHGHALVSRDTTDVLDAATTTLGRAFDAALVYVAVEVGGAPVAMNLRSR